MEEFRCVTCRVKFNEALMHREHFKSDWHLYNLKRKVINAHPISIEEFVQLRSEIEAGSCASSDFGETDWYCGYCSKRFQSKRAMLNHRMSKAHQKRESDHVKRGKMKVAAMTEKAVELGFQPPSRDEINEILRSPSRRRKTISTWAKGDSPRENWLIENEVIEIIGDDNRISEDEEEDFEEDSKWSDIDSVYSTNSAIFIGGEQRDIPTNECIFCGQVFNSTESCLKHMIEIHGFRIPDESFLVSRDDFMAYISSKVGKGNICLVCNQKGKTFYSLDAVRKHMLSKGHCRVDMSGENAFEYVDFYDFSQSDDEPEFLRSELQDDHTLKMDTSSTEISELVLPSGAVIGNRQLNKYFKQKANFAVVVSKRNNAPPKYRSICCSPDQELENEKLKEKDLRVLWAKKNKNRLNNEIRANRQKHFKDPTGLLR